MSKKSSFIPADLLYEAIVDSSDDAIVSKNLHSIVMMGMLARKMWQSEYLVRKQKWPSWHPFLPFLGDEVTGKTIAIIGTGRIGLAMIKKCSGFDMMAKLVANQMYGVSARDPFSFALVSLLLAVTSLLTCGIAARRALNVDPMEALRCE